MRLSPVKKGELTNVLGNPTRSTRSARVEVEDEQCDLLKTQRWLVEVSTKNQRRELSCG